MMERLLERLEERSNDLVADMLDALGDKLTALLGERAVIREDDRITVQSFALDQRRLIDPRFRFLFEMGR